MHRAWGAYPDTILTFPDAGIVVDLRRELTPAIRRRLIDAGLPRAFAVVTSCNPLGRLLDESSNRRLATVLAIQIAAKHPAARPVLGGSPDGSHREPGWALMISLDEAKGLARSFLQNAVFWYDGSCFAIVPVHAPGPALALPAPAEGGPES